MQSGIYQIIGPGKVYIGQAVDVVKRFIQHKRALKNKKHRNAHLQHAWNKYGEQAFSFEPLAFFPIEDLDAAEQVAIDSLPEEQLYNIALFAGSPGRGVKRSSETRKRMSLAQTGNRSWLGRKHSEETKNKMRLAKLGKPKTDEAKRKMSIAAQNPERWAHLLKRAAQLKGKPGKKHTLETKQKISLIRRGLL